jgi:hypothetical protein
LASFSRSFWPCSTLAPGGAASCTCKHSKHSTMQYNACSSLRPAPPTQASKPVKDSNLYRRFQAASTDTSVRSQPPWQAPVRVSGTRLCWTRS